MTEKQINEAIDRWLWQYQLTEISAETCVKIIFQLRLYAFSKKGKGSKSK